MSTERTSKQLYQKINVMRFSGLIWDEIVIELLPGVNREAARTALYRFYRDGTAITNNEMRSILGLEKLYDDVPESYLRKTKRGSSPPRPRRVAVHCTDLDSAYATLSSDSNFSRSFIRDLVDRLVTEYLVPFEV